MQKVILMICTAIMSLLTLNIQASADVINTEDGDKNYYNLLDDRSLYYMSKANQINNASYIDDQNVSTRASMKGNYPGYLRDAIMFDIKPSDFLVNRVRVMTSSTPNAFKDNARVFIDVKDSGKSVIASASDFVWSTTSTLSLNANYAKANTIHFNFTSDRYNSTYGYDGCGNGTCYIYDVEITGTYAFKNATNVKAVDITDKSAKITWDKPTTHADKLTNFIVVKGGDNVTTSKTTKSYTMTNLKPNKQYYAYVYSKYENGRTTSSQIVTFKTLDAPVNATKIKDLVAKDITHKSATLSWAKEATATKYVIYKINSDNVATKVTETTSLTYKINNLTDDTSYKYAVSSIDSQPIESDKTNVSFKTSVIPDNATKIKDLVAKDITHKSATLSWAKEDTATKYVIYKINSDNVATKVTETTSLTYKINNLTDDTSYKYAVSSANENNKESKKESVEFKTKADPPVTLDKPTVDENGDYTFTWSEPSEGKLQIFVGGQKYQVVNASAKKIVIPAAAMRYTPMGDPDVTFQKIDESGDLVGDVVRPPSIEFAELPSDLTGTNLLKVSTALLLLVGGFLLLNMSFLVVPKLINLIRGGSGGGAEQVARDINKRRRTGG